MLVQMLAALIFAIGMAVVVCRRNLFFILMGIELMLNAVNLSFVGFSRTFSDACLPRRLYRSLVRHRPRSR